MSVPDREDTHVTTVQIFKSHDDHHEYIQGQFLFQLTDYIKINGTMMQLNRSMLAPVPFGTTSSKLSSRAGLLELVHYSVLDSKSFAELASKILAEKITARIMSRFRFMTTTSCSNIIIAVNVVRIYTSGSGFDLQIFELVDHGGVSISFGLLTSENHEEDSDDGDGDGDGDDDNDEEDMDDGDDDNEDSENDEEDMDDGDDESDDGEYYNSFAGFEEDYISEIKGFSEVTGLVSAKPHELNSMDRCSICLEEYGSDCSGVAKAETSVCSHIFHRDCIHQWLRKFSNRCPLCRSVFLAQI